MRVLASLSVLVFLLVSLSANSMVCEGVFAQRQAMDSKQMLGELGSQPLAFDALKGAFRNILVFKGLPANSFVEFKLLRSHPYDETKSLLKMLAFKTDQNGEINLSAKLVEYSLGRTLKLGEQKYADELFLKSMGETSNSNLPMSLSQFLPALEKGRGEKFDHLVVEINAVGTAPQFRHVSFKEIEKSVRVTPLDPDRDGLVGDIFEPHPSNANGETLVLWGGSGSFYSRAWAQDLASRGIRVVAMRYFTYDSTDPNISKGAIYHLIDRTPLELYERAIKKALSLPGVDPSRVSILGESRGGESALLIAQHLGNKYKLKNVIALRPLHFSVGSKINGPDFKGEPEKASWTLEGDEIPYAAMEIGKEQFPEAIRLTKERDGLKFEKVDGVDVPIVFLKHVFTELQPKGSQFVDVSRFNGKIIVVAGEQDALWQAEEAANFLREQRKHSGHLDDQIISVRNAGHFTFPGRPSTVIPDEVRFLVGVVEDVPKNQAAFVLDGGVGVGRAIYDVLNQEVVYRALGLSSSERPLPFKDFVQ